MIEDEREKNKYVDGSLEAMERQFSSLNVGDEIVNQPSSQFTSEALDSENDNEQNRQSFKTKNVWDDEDDLSEDDEKAGKAGVKWHSDVEQIDRPDKAEIKKMGTGMIGS
jgi:hypothetical protein